MSSDQILFNNLAPETPSSTGPANAAEIAPENNGNSDPVKAIVGKSKTRPGKTNGTGVLQSTEKSVQKMAIHKETNAATPKNGLTITFQLRFHTQYGQDLFITGNHPLLGNGSTEKALPLQYFNEDFWYATIEIPAAAITDKPITYNYIVRNPDGSASYDWGSDKTITLSAFTTGEVLLVDAWNYAGYQENAFYTEPFQEVLLKANRTPVALQVPATITHTFKVKAPLLPKGYTICLLGNNNTFHNWQQADPILMNRAEGDDFYQVQVNLLNEQFPIAYKYGVYDLENKRFIRYEDGNNRILFDTVFANKQTIVNDGFVVLPATTWKGAGIAIPVFSLRTDNSFGTGEFTDLEPLVNWSKQVGLKLIQVLPINDTTATHTWMDSYPYAAISAFALHPLYVNLDALVEDANKEILNRVSARKKELNSLPDVDYQAVTELKWQVIKQVYPLQKKATFQTTGYQQYFEQNKHWLEPYAAFCYLRDTYNTADFNQWPEYSQYDAAAIKALTHKEADGIAIHYFVQYHLHLQLQKATAYAHANGIILKGDIAIGVYRFGADAWQQPHLYHMELQAGAPPDDFAVKGQNWGFPTYNWQHMKQDGFAWWKQRFEQMSYYFDAFRIDHILGFFRIWSIPMDAVEGILGYFVPAIPIQAYELSNRGIAINDMHRYTQPFINDEVLWQVFRHDAEYAKQNFLQYDGFGRYALQPAYNTQRKVERHFVELEHNELNNRLKQGLYDLISNVILFEVAGTNGQQFHFRFAISSTSSFQQLDQHTQQQLDELYVNYFFRRQDDFWMKEAMQKLPALKRVTNMLVCGEDLGLVPACVPDVMKQLGLLSLEIQRMPKDPHRPFFNPREAPYLSVVTPSTHDMSTIRGWWEEDRERTQQFYNHELGKEGGAPFYCEAWINKEIVLQHLHSPAMWSIFQLQDLLGMDAQIRRQNPNEERINVPANPKNYWRYRMHLTIEALQQATAFNKELNNAIRESGR